LALLALRGERGQNPVTVPAPNQHTFSVAHVHHLAEVVRRWDVARDALLAGLSISSETLADPHGRIAVPAMIALLDRARGLTGEPALGVYCGLQTRATLYGSLGFALTSAATIRDAIDLSIKYGKVVTTAVSMRFRTDRGLASLTVEEHTDFGDVRDIVVMTTLIAWWKVSAALTGRELTTSTLEFALPEPSYLPRLAMTGLRMRFLRPAHRLTFDARSLDLPYTMPDPVALALAREQCERELEALGMTRGELTARVRGLIPRQGGGFRTLEEVASAMNRSPRTLKRQLATSGISFSTLRDSEFQERAIALLRLPDLSLRQIADRLGYSNAANFERAFRRCTASSPATWRRTMMGQTA
jgi:AraC-like DNA-binding protein